MKFYFRYSLLSILLYITLSYAQTPSLYFENLSTGNGLSSNSISAIYQDYLGFLWFATDNGLDKYDGYSFKHYGFVKAVENIAPKNKIQIKEIVNLRKDTNDLLLATNIGLLFLRQESDSIDYLPNVQFNKIVNIKKTITTDSGGIWAAQPTRLYYYQPGSESLQLFHFRSKDNRILQIMDMAYDHKKRLWVAAGPELFLFNSLAGTFDKIQFPNSAHLKSKKSRIYQISIGQDGDLWFLIDPLGLVRFNYEKKQFDKAVPVEVLFQGGRGYKISEMMYSGDGNIWISTKGYGLYKFDRTTNEIIVYMRHMPIFSGLGGNQINDIYLDRSGVFWAAIKGHGLNFFRFTSTKFYDYILQPPEYYQGKQRAIYSIYQDDNKTIWLGPVNHTGIYSIDALTGKTNLHLIQKPRNSYSSTTTFNSIYGASDSELWVTSLSAGLTKFNIKTNKFISVFKDKPKKPLNGNDRIFNGFYDSAGYIWLNPGKYWIYRYDPKSKNLKKYNFGKAQKKGKEVIRSFLETKNGQILFGTTGGNVYRLDSNQDTLFQYFTIQFNNKRIHIRNIAEDNQGDLWIATGRGLFVYRINTGKTERIAKDDGLISNNLSTLLLDKYGNLWMSHDRGISRLVIGLGKITNYYNKSGLNSNIFTQNSSFRTAEGDLLFGNLNGCTVVSPQPDIHFPDAPLRITNFIIQSSTLSDQQMKEFQHAIFLGNDIKLPYDNYGFMIDFSLLDFKDPQLNQYRYKLIGQSDEWIDLGNKHLLSFVGLPAGSYTFRVQAKNAAREWSPNEIALNFEIEIPFWKSWWFYTWLVILFIMVVFTIYRVRVYAVRLRNKELEQINRKLNEQIDIRRRIEYMLKENEIKYRTLVEGITDGIFTLDANGIFYFLNNIAGSRIGGTPEEYTGKSVYEYYPTEIVDPLIDQVRQVLDDGQSRKISARIPQNGKFFDYDVTLHPLQNERGENTLVLCIAVDTSEKKALESQLRQSQKMEAIGNLAGGIAHDFNNLLSVIRGYSYLLLADEKAGSALHESLKEIDTAADRAQGLTRQLLAFSRKQLLEPRVINLNAQIQGIYKMLRRLIREDIEINMRLSDDLNHIFADPGQVEQVIMNLVLNAGDAMPRGGKLTIQTQNSGVPQKLIGVVQHFESKAYAELSITDSGMGMDKETLLKIFDPFFTTKEKGKGTGLGLSTVFGIVKQSDGYIWVDSEPGKGSTFTLFFPSVDKQTLAEETDVTDRTELRGSETILIVEDELSVRLMIVKMLKLYGYKTIVAANGQDGIKGFYEHQGGIDLILSDVVMPDMSGVEMMQKILDKNPLSKYVLMSGYTDEEIVRHGILDRGIHFIQKPFTPDALMRKIRMTLDLESHLSSD